MPKATRGATKYEFKYFTDSAKANAEGFVPVPGARESRRGREYRKELPLVIPKPRATRKNVNELANMFEASARFTNEPRVAAAAPVPVDVVRELNSRIAVPFTMVPSLFGAPPTAPIVEGRIEGWGGEEDEVMGTNKEMNSLADLLGSSTLSNGQKKNKNRSGGRPKGRKGRKTRKGRKGRK